MKKIFFLSMLAAGTVAIFSGCASDKGEKTETKTETTKEAKPQKDKRPKEERLAKGMTKDEVRAAIGNPRGTSVNSDGTEMWMYNNAERAFIPYYGLTGGKFQNLVVTFDKDGKVASWSSNSTGRY